MQLNPNSRIKNEIIMKPAYSIYKENSRETFDNSAKPFYGNIAKKQNNLLLLQR
jgi:hypothetical protein